MTTRAERRAKLNTALDMLKKLGVAPIDVATWDWLHSEQESWDEFKKENPKDSERSLRGWIECSRDANLDDPRDFIHCEYDKLFRMLSYVGLPRREP